VLVAVGALAALAGFGQAQDQKAGPRRGPTAVAYQARFDAQGRVLEVAAQEKPAPAATAAHYNAQGERISEKDAQALAAAAASANACLTLYNGPGLTWKIDVTFNPNTYPFAITGGTIKGNICGSPNWVVTGGSMGPNLLINAKRTGGGGSCASTVTIVGHFQDPPSYAGTYGFDGVSTSFSHTSLYCCGTCPP
jgi:hypothetical protein